MKIYVGNLSYKTVDADLHSLFSSQGAVDSAAVVMDRQTGQSRGFGFVEMPDATEARNAIANLNGKDLGGRALRVNEAEARPAGGGGGGGRGNGGYGGGGRSGGGRSGGGGGYGGGGDRW
jgi:RNA recognition motif-containing protein